MRDMRSNQPQDTAPQMHSLSQVSFQHGLRLGGGPEFGRELIAKELTSLQRRDDVTFELSPEQLQHYLEARRFLEAHYQKLGLQFHPGGRPFVYSSPRDGAGICMTLSRSPGVLYQKGESREFCESVSLWVHELTHATASILWGAERDSGKPSRWRFTISRAGCMLRPKATSSLGVLFEEHAACANQSAYLAEHGDTREIRREKGFKLPSSWNSAAELKFFKVFKRICDPGMYAEIESSDVPRRWERTFVRQDSRLEVSVESLSWINGLGRERGMIYPVALLDRLASEIFPGLSSTAAAEHLRELVIRAQVTGQMAELLVPIKGALGQDALLFLLEWGQDLSRIADGTESALLSLFVRAGSLGQDEAKEVRRELRAALNETRRKDSGSSSPEGIEIERLLLEGEQGKWSAWTDTRRVSLGKAHPDLQAYAAQQLTAAMRTKDFAQAAQIFLVAGLPDEQRPTAPFSRLSQYSRELLVEGKIRTYQQIVEVFEPERALVSRKETQRLTYEATVTSLRAGYIGVFCDAATSPLCDREALLSPEVRRLVQAKLKGTMSFMARLTLERALEGESLPE